MAGLFDTISGASPSFNTSLLDPDQQVALSQFANSPAGQGPAPMVQPVAPQPQVPQPSAPPGATVPNHSLTGLLGIHGFAGNLLNWLGDNIAMASGMHLNYTDDPTKRAQATAMSQFATNPASAVQGLANVGDTQGALEAQQSLAQQKHAEAEQQLATQEAVQKRADQVRSQAGNVLSAGASDPSTYEALVNQVQKTFGDPSKSLDGKPVDLSPVIPFSPADLPKYTTKDDKGNTVWTPQAKSMLEQAGNFGAQQFKYAGTNAAQTRANASALTADIANSLAPTRQAYYEARIAAAPTEAAAAMIRAQAAAEAARSGADRASVYRGINTDANGNIIPVTDPGRHPQGRGSNRRPAPGAAPAPSGNASSIPFPAAQYKGKILTSPSGQKFLSDGNNWNPQ